MKTTRASLFYILSLAILGILMALVFFRSLTSGNHYSTIQKEQLLETKDGWIIQLDLINQGEKETSYRLSFTVGKNNPYEETVLVPAGGIYTYTHHFKAKKDLESTVQMTIYREKETTPLEQTIYHLK